MATLALAVALPSVAQATLTITNGNFETYDPTQTTGGNYPGVYQWFNAQNPTAPWYFNVSQATAVSPSGSASVVMTGNHDATDGVPIPWIYQSIGFNTEGKTTLPIQFDLGGFTDNNPVSAHIDVQLFKATGFTGADNTDILGAAAATQVGSTFSIERLGFAGNSGMLKVSADLDLTGVAPTDELFLRFQSTVPTGSTDSNYVRLDNIKIRPDVVYVPIDLTYAGLSAGGTWDTGASAHFKDASNVATVFHEGDRITFDDSGAVDGSNVSIVNVSGEVSPGNVTINNSHDYLFQGGGIINGQPGATLTKSGTGKVTFANLGGGGFAGGINILAGTVELSGQTNDAAQGIGGGAITNNGTIIINRQYADAGAINEWNPLTIEQPISGTGGIDIKSHALIGKRADASSVSTFTGPVTIESGAFVYLGNVTGLGSTTSGTTVMSGGTLGFVDEWHMGANAVIAEPLTLNGPGVVSWFGGGNPSGALFVWEGVRTVTGSVTLASTSSINTRGTSDLTLAGSFTAAAGAGLVKEGDGSLRIPGTSLQSVTMYAGKLYLTGGVLKTKTLSIESTTLLDLGTGGLLVDYDPGGSPIDQIKQWKTDGIFLATNSTYTLAIVDTAQTPIASFGGYTLDGSAVIARATLPGDANLDLVVNFGDLLALAANYGSTTSSWGAGDFTDDNVTNFSDLLALAANYNKTVTGSFAGDWALAQQLVPEPAALASLMAAGVLLIRRRLA
ncbi:MAG: hypothetical protein QM770_14280 [Tepidisphaeraceae bacterium]